MNVHVRAPSSMATIIYDSIELTSGSTLPLAGKAFQQSHNIIKFYNQALALLLAR